MLKFDEAASGHCPEVYVSTASAKIRDELWTAVAASTDDDIAALAHPADFDGLTLVPSAESQKMANLL